MHKTVAEANLVEMRRSMIGEASPPLRYQMKTGLRFLAVLQFASGHQTNSVQNEREIKAERQRKANEGATGSRVGTGRTCHC